MPPREELIRLLSGLLLTAQTSPAHVPLEEGPCLVQDYNAPTSFPHVVEIDGAPVHPAENSVWQEREGAQWQQCATKMTRFGLRLVDGQGSLV